LASDIKKLVSVQLQAQQRQEDVNRRVEARILHLTGTAKFHHLHGPHSPEQYSQLLSCLPQPSNPLITNPATLPPSVHGAASPAYVTSEGESKREKEQTNNTKKRKDKEGKNKQGSKQEAEGKKGKAAK